jgi:hemerythrin superfamily protein
MSIIDKVISAVTPPESDQEARARAQRCAARSPWLAMVLDHHLSIEAAFAKVEAANDASSRLAAQKELGKVLTGHSIAEEVAIYPALSDAGETGHATMAYTEQSAAKMQMGLLERLDPMSQEYIDKLGHIKGAVMHHVYEEEGTWFSDLAESASDADQQMITQRYTEEYERYMGSDAHSDGMGAGEKSAFFGSSASQGQPYEQVKDSTAFDRDDGMSSGSMNDERDNPGSTYSPGSGIGRGLPSSSDGSSTDDTAGGDDLMSPGKSTTGLPEFR